LTGDTYNPFPNYSFTGSLRPAYPLSPKRIVPDHIPRPDYAENGLNISLLYIESHTFDNFYSGTPLLEIQQAGQPPRVLSPEEQEKMRVVCRVRFHQNITTSNLSWSNQTLTFPPDHLSLRVKC
jgi:methionyl aminopeptidase